LAEVSSSVPVREDGHQLRTSWSKQERMGNYERAGANKREWAITNELEQTRENGQLRTSWSKQDRMGKLGQNDTISDRIAIPILQF
jgi:hypothetical protein